MTESDDAGLDTGMDTGSETGSPGEHLAEPPLTADEQQLLADLRTDDGSPAEPGVEDSPAMARAADEDTPLPALGGDEDDADAVEFRAPGE